MPADFWMQIPFKIIQNIKLQCESISKDLQIYKSKNNKNRKMYKKFTKSLVIYNSVIYITEYFSKIV